VIKGQRVTVTTGRDQGKSATVLGSLIGHGPVMAEIKVDGCIESRYILPSLLVPLTQENDCETVDYKPDVCCATQPIG
jgi:hypothetical protein